MTLDDLRAAGWNIHAANLDRLPRQRHWRHRPAFRGWSMTAERGGERIDATGPTEAEAGRRLIARLSALPQAA